MSSYEPPEESDREAADDAGATGKGVTDNRQFSDVLGSLDRVDFIVLGVLLAVPAGLVTLVLVVQFVPGFQETAGELFDRVLDAVVTLL